jgi:hypothetical protein
MGITGAQVFSKDVCHVDVANRWPSLSQSPLVVETRLNLPIPLLSISEEVLE